MNKYFKLAKKVALKDTTDYKHYWLGAIGIRNDGCLVHANNIRNMTNAVDCHAEARLAKKLDVGSIVYVVRIQKSTNNYMCAKPCGGCYLKLKNRGVKKIYYSINNNTYGVIVVKK